MSPSTMSCMSATLLRNMRVRSIPIPKAKPEYSSGSIPAARRTFGFTMPQPPHSIHCGPPLAFGCHKSSSAEGSVNGRSSGAGESWRPHRTWRVPYSRVPFRSAMVRPLSTADPQSGERPGCGSRPAHRCGTPDPGTQCTAADHAKAASADLHRRSVSAQQQVSVLRLNVESVLHFACRVVRLCSKRRQFHSDSSSGPSATSLSPYRRRCRSGAPASEQSGGDRPGNGEPKQQKRPQLPQPGCEPHAHLQLSGASPQ